MIIIPGLVSGTHHAVPYSDPKKLATRYCVALIGWPTNVAFKDISRLKLEELRLVEKAARDGSCHFVDLGRPVRKRKPRSDRFDCRGRQYHPYRPRRKRGKIHLTPEIVPGNGELEDDPIEDFSD